MPGAVDQALTSQPPYRICLVAQQHVLHQVQRVTAAAGLVVVTTYRAVVHRHAAPAIRPTRSAIRRHRPSSLVRQTGRRATFRLAGRVVTGLEYRLAAGWDGARNDRRAPHPRPAYGKAGAGPVLELPWRLVLRLAGDWWDEADAQADCAALERYKRVVDRLEAGDGERSYFVPDGAVRKAAPAGDSVEIVDRIRPARGRPAGRLVRASARRVRVSTADGLGRAGTAA